MYGIFAAPPRGDGMAMLIIIPVIEPDRFKELCQSSTRPGAVFDVVTDRTDALSFVARRLGPQYMDRAAARLDQLGA